jgi:hypothetical protein
MAGMKTHTLTITLTDEQYQMLVAQTHYENWWLVNHTEDRVQPISAERFAAGVLAAWLTETREKVKKEFDEQFAAIHAQRDDFESELPDASGDPGMHSDIVAALERLDNSEQALLEEWDAFNGPRPTPTP